MAFGQRKQNKGAKKPKGGQIMKDLLFLLNGRGKSVPAAARFSFNQEHYSVNGAMQTFSDLFTTTRATNAWGIVDGELEQYASGQPVINSNGLAVFEASTNIARASSDLSSVTPYWSGAGSFTVESATSIGNGLGLTAYKHTNTGVASASRGHTTLATTVASPTTAYFILEEGSAAKSELSLYDATQAGNIARLQFDWATKTVSIAASTYGLSVSVFSELLKESGPNGGALYKVGLTATPDTAGNTQVCYVYPTGLTSNTDYAILHHVQIEVSGFASPPIVTTTAPYTRDADVIINNASISSWFNSLEGTVYISATTPNPPASGSSSAFAQFDDGTTVNRMLHYYTGVSVNTRPTSFIMSAGITQASMSSDIPDTGEIKYASAYKANDAELVLNGSSAATDTVLSVASGIDTLRLGSVIGGTSSLNGYIQELRYYNSRLSQSNMVTITS